MPVKFHDVNVGDIQARHGLTDGQLNCCPFLLGELVYLAHPAVCVEVDATIFFSASVCEETAQPKWPSSA